MSIELKDVIHFYLGCDIQRKSLTQPGYTIVKLTISSLKTILEYNNWVEAKPILRPLSDMTEEEKIMLCCLNMPTGWQPGHIIQTNDDDIAAMRIFDMKGNYKSLYIPKNRISPNNFVWLLSKSFDLFNLISTNQALDKSIVK